MATPNPDKEPVVTGMDSNARLVALETAMEYLITKFHGSTAMEEVKAKIEVALNKDK